MQSSGADDMARPEVHKTLKDSEVHMLEDASLTQ